MHLPGALFPAFSHVTASSASNHHHAASPEPPEHRESPGATAPADQPLLLDEVRVATALLTRIINDRSLLVPVPAAERHRLLEAVAQVFNPDARSRRAMVKATARERKKAAAERDDELLHQTGIRALRRQPVFTTPNVYRLHDPRDADPQPSAAREREDAPSAVVPQHCYICKQKFTAVHHFYDQMCVPCGDVNFAKRTELVDLTGCTALLTGGRVKIGYQAGLKMLRCGARVLVTTRFPRDSAMRYAAEPDFTDWSHRLEVFGLDLRHTPSVEAFCHTLLEQEARLDYIINNACQTVRRPPAFYAHMMEREAASVHELPANARQLLGTYESWRNDRQLTAGIASETNQRLSSATPAHVGLTQAASLSQVPLLPDDLLVSHTLFPDGKLDQDLQQIDLRDRNSWRLLLHEVPSVELLEVQLVNAIAPFIINARLKPLMLRTDNRDKHIVNVSAMEGQFYRNSKTTRHPHTNMAKAALNMMTRTSATDYAQDGIHMNSVDTGWVTDEDAAELAARKAVNHRFHPPLDIIDGAARIVDPIISGTQSGTHVWGQFLKDYRPTDW